MKSVFVTLAVALGVGATCATGAAAQVVLASQTGGSAALGSTNYPGQSFTVAGAGAFNNIAFNFYSYPSAASRLAMGNLYLYSVVYAGTPADLPSGSGLIAAAAAANNVYTFDPSVVLNAGNKYYAYSDTAFQVSGRISDFYPGGEVYYSTGGGNFRTASQDLNFQVVGSSISAVPEPAAWGMMLAGFGALGLTMRRRRAVKIGYAA